MDKRLATLTFALLLALSCYLLYRVDQLEKMVRGAEARAIASGSSEIAIVDRVSNLEDHQSQLSYAVDGIAADLSSLVGTVNQHAGIINELARTAHSHY